jgi:DNA-binding NarL/FixJ family response regulator
MKTTIRTPLRILITDDHAMMRVGIKQILKDDFKNVALGEAANAEQTFRQLGKRQWDLLILDITMPGRDGLDALREIKERYPKLPVLMFSVHPEEQLAMRAFKLGAAGYLPKERTPEELPVAVRHILAGGTYVTQTVAERLVGQIGARTRLRSHESLSEREFQVMRMIAAGASGKRIAMDLGLSQKTVSTYRSRLLTKLGLKTTADLIQYAIHNKLLR